MKSDSSLCGGVNGKDTSKYNTPYSTYGGVNILTHEEKYSYGASYRVRTHKFLCTLMRDIDELHFIETSR